MNILAIETTGPVAAAAIVCKDRVAAEFAINNKLTHSQVLMSLIDSMFKAADFDKTDIDFIACSAGPGSFTGLRIGAAAAKGLAFGLSRKIVPVSTLDALAYNIAGGEGFQIAPIMDARRNQVYTALYQKTNDGINRLTDYMACDFDELVSLAQESGASTMFLGDGVAVHRDKIINMENFAIAPLGFLHQRVAAVGAVALNTTSTAIASEDFAPFYIRGSQADGG